MNTRFVEPSSTDPLQEQIDLLARAAALDAADALPAPDAPSTVGYRAAGRTLVVGNAGNVLPWADRLAQRLDVTAVLLDAEADALPARTYPVFAARAAALAGWLGNFEAAWQAPHTVAHKQRFDLVLDLCASPLITSHQRPHGYYAPGPHAHACAAAASAMLDMVGEFEKPRYFNYQDRLCAHSRNERPGCSACIDICSARAIAPDGEHIKVNPYLCAGCGACTTVCPTGALAYAYPGAVHTGARIRTALSAFIEAGGKDPVLLVHGAAEGAALLAHAQLPGRAIALPVYHTASVGIDVWLCAIAYGAAGVAVMMTDAEAPQYAAALDQQMAVAQAVLDALGYAGPHFQLVRASTPADLDLMQRHLPRGRAPARAAAFHLAADKRNTLDYALDHLHKHAPQQPHEAVLPAGSPFGTLVVDRAKCSLCMSCVGACPASALMDGHNLPQLRFVEKNCVQCGLCASTCPEDAIRLVPRLSFADTRNQAVVLNETQPFCCIRCGEAFGTLQMVENMLSRLSGHPAFAGHLERLRMCGDCRVRDMMQPGGEMAVALRRRV